MYSRYNEEKSVAAEKFITFLSYNIHIYKHMTDVSKNVYFHVLNDIVDKYNKPFRRTIGIKPIGVKSDFYAVNIMLILMKKIINLKLVIM